MLDQESGDLIKRLRDMPLFRDEFSSEDLTVAMATVRLK